MVAVGLWYGQAYVMDTNTGAFIDGILNAQRYHDEILRLIVVAIHPRPSPHVAAWPASSPDMSPIEHVWDGLDRRFYDSAFQFLPIYPATSHSH